ncbi:MAG: hypothetical protein ACLTSL_01305 [Odoribacter splanchnicus]
MKDKIYVTIGLLVSVLSVFVFFFYPLHDSWVGTVNVAKILENSSESNGLLVFGGFVYVVSVILMLIGVIEAGNGRMKNVISLFTGATVFPVSFPFFFGLMRTNSWLESQLLDEEYIWLLVFLAIVQIILLTVSCRMEEKKTGAAVG